MFATKAHLQAEAVVVDRRQLTFFRSVLRKWAGRNFASFPWRRTRNRYHALVAEIMLQRTRATQVVPVYCEFARRFPTPRHASLEKSSRFQRILKPLGLRWRARILRELSIALSASGGKVPTTLGRLRALPGVGEYVAAAFCTFHLKTASTLIDANIVRLYGRFYGFETGPETRRNRTFRALADLVQPRKDARSFCYGLLDFTRKVCAPKPQCDICPLRQMCHYRRLRGR
jgi:A/G-specific adenine glycosylase